jgi:hypothetical protein
MITKEEYLKAKETVAKYEKQLELQNVSYYYLKDGDDVKLGDEFYDYDIAQEWVKVKEPFTPYKHNTETCYETRRKL